MKIICTKENLLKGINIVSSCIKKSASLSILSNILLEVEKGQIKLSATNLEIGIINYIRGKIEKEGRAVIPAQLFLSYVNNLPQEKIILSLEGDVLTLACNDFRADIKCYDPNEFPLIPEVEGEIICKFKGDELKTSISKVVFASAKDESRPEIAGILLKLGKKESFLAATDSYRLAEKKVKTEEVNVENDYIIPADTILEVGKIINSDNTIEVVSSEGQLKFSFDNVIFISKIVDGQYPDYKQIIPDGSTVKIKLNRNEFIQALKSSSLFSKQDTNEVNIETDLKNKEIIIQAESKQVGVGKTKLSTLNIEGKDEKVIFNHQYILEGLSAIKSSEVLLLFNNDSGPAVLKAVDDDSYLYIIMPIKK